MVALQQQPSGLQEALQRGRHPVDEVAGVRSLETGYPVRSPE